MFSYRHAFHAGNHADVLKHLTLLGCLRHMGQKDTGFSVVDTHAGTGLYRLDQEQARTSGESLAGVQRLLDKLNGQANLSDLLTDYIAMVRSFNSGASVRHYPGSPWIAQQVLRPQDKLKLFEVHPTDARLLERNVRDLGRGRQIEVLRSNGFEGLKGFLPPVSRRALVLMDPSYELKTDYAEVGHCLQDALKRFPTGCYAIWYPVIARPEAHSLGKRLKTLSKAAQRPWLQAELNVGSAPKDGPDVLKPGAGIAPRNPKATQLRASAMHIINPPFTLAQGLRDSLPEMLRALRESAGASFRVETG